MRIGAFILSVVGAALLAACGPSGTYYEKTPEQVAAALKKAYLPTHVLGSGIKRSKVTQPDPNTIVTALIGANGTEAMRFVTTITPDGTGSRVLTEVRAPEGVNNERANEVMADQAHVMALMDGLANEHVAAAIEGRPFDMMFATNPMAKGMLSNQPGVQEQINEANASAAEWSRMEQEMAANPPANPGWSDDSSEPAFGEPMDDAQGSSE
jgi:hypothetical protein